MGMKNETKRRERSDKVDSLPQLDGCCVVITNTSLKTGLPIRSEYGGG